MQELSLAADGNSAEFKVLTTTLDILREHQQYWELAVQYNELGNSELRDKYVELALRGEHDDDTLIFLRSMQGRHDLIPEEIIKREVRRRKKYSDWSQLARLYEKVGDYKNAVLNYCKTITESLAEGNAFSAAYYLKELSETELHRPLFQAAYRESTEAGDLWWQIRALQELGWTDELAAVVVAHRTARRQKAYVWKCRVALLRKGPLRVRRSGKSVKLPSKCPAQQ